MASWKRNVTQGQTRMPGKRGNLWVDRQCDDIKLATYRYIWHQMYQPLPTDIPSKLCK